MRKHTNTGTRLFLIEFLIVLFFFLIISSVCLRMFAAGYQLSETSAALSKAQMEISSSVAVIRQTDGSALAVEEKLHGLTGEKNLYAWETATLQDEDERITIMEPEYRLEILFLEDRHLLLQAVTKDESILYEMEIVMETPLTRGEVLQ